MEYFIVRLHFEKRASILSVSTLIIVLKCVLNYGLHIIFCETFQRNQTINMHAIVGPMTKWEKQWHSGPDTEA